MMVAEDIQLMRETRDATDRRLIHRCIEGDQDAWKEIVIKLRKLLR